MPAVDEPEIRVSTFAEEAHVDKVEVVSDRVRVTTSTDEHEAIAKGVIERGALRVERVAVERQVEMQRRDFAAALDQILGAERDHRARMAHRAA